jgi:phosphoribosylcarboxyaminoimidazole (NCAIR) mutase
MHYLFLQMPKGVPVATVAIGNAANAGLLAVRILATSNKSLLDKMLLYQVLMVESEKSFLSIGTCQIFCFILRP